MSSTIDLDAVKEGREQRDALVEQNPETVDMPVETVLEAVETAKPDPFDPATLRLAQGLDAELGVKKALIQVPVRKPRPQEFFRVHPGEDYRLDTTILELKDEREIYLVMPEMRGALLGEIVSTRLFAATNRQGIVFLIPVRLPGEDGRSNPWHESLMRAAGLAMASWIRVRADMSLGGYQPFIASGNLPEPEWPDESLGELLRIAFSGNRIDVPDHPVIRRLFGAA